MIEIFFSVIEGVTTPTLNSMIFKPRLGWNYCSLRTVRRSSNQESHSVSIETLIDKLDYNLSYSLLIQTDPRLWVFSTIISIAYDKLKSVIGKIFKTSTSCKRC